MEHGVNRVEQLSLDQVAWQICLGEELLNCICEASTVPLNLSIFGVGLRGYVTVGRESTKCFSLKWIFCASRQLLPVLERRLLILDTQIEIESL